MQLEPVHFIIVEILNALYFQDGKDKDPNNVAKGRNNDLSFVFNYHVVLSRNHKTLKHSKPI